MKLKREKKRALASKKLESLCAGWSLASLVFSQPCGHIDASSLRCFIRLMIRKPRYFLHSQQANASSCQYLFVLPLFLSVFHSFFIRFLLLSFFLYCLVFFTLFRCFLLPFPLSALFLSFFLFFLPSYCPSFCLFFHFPSSFH